MVAPLEEFITPKSLQAANSEWLPKESEFLCSVAIVMPKAQEESFLESYSSLDASSVPVGPEGRRDSVKGSPVVPGSAW